MTKTVNNTTQKITLTKTNPSTILTHLNSISPFLRFFVFVLTEYS